jgi:hypothetical protein
MARLSVALALTAFLAACGAAGAPEPVAPVAPPDGRIGVTGSL